jgi:hypothetical protein
MKVINVSDMMNNQPGKFDINDFLRNNVVFIKIYNQGCGHCNAMQDEWGKLSNMKQSNANVSLMEILDSELNNIHHDMRPEIQGVPTLALSQPNYNNNQTKKINLKMFEGPRTANDMIQFITKSVPKPHNSMKINYLNKTIKKNKKNKKKKRNQKKQTNKKKSMTIGGKKSKRRSRRKSKRKSRR